MHHDSSSHAVNGDRASVGDLVTCSRQVRHAWESVLARDHDCVGDDAPGFDNDTTDDGEHRGPARISGDRDEDVARLDLADLRQVSTGTRAVPVTTPLLAPIPTSAPSASTLSSSKGSQPRMYLGGSCREYLS